VSLYKILITVAMLLTHNIPGQNTQLCVNIINNQTCATIKVNSHRCVTLNFIHPFIEELI